MLSKEFPGGILVLTGANSATGLRSMPARYLFLDEIDAYPPSADEEGDPVTLAEARPDRAFRVAALRAALWYQPGGEVLAATRSKGGIARVEVDIDTELARSRRVLDHLAERRPETYTMEPEGTPPCA